MINLLTLCFSCKVGAGTENSVWAWVAQTRDSTMDDRIDFGVRPIQVTPHLSESQWLDF